MKQVALRLDDDVAAELDRQRGNTKRETWIKALIARELAQQLNAQMQLEQIIRQHSTANPKETT